MKHLLVLLALAISITTVAQDSEPTYQIVEVMPKYGDSKEDLYKYLGDSLVYPKKAQDSGIEGQVYVSFVVDTFGNTENVEIIRGVHELLDGEAMRVVEAMDGWTPGTQGGKKVKVMYRLPVTFKLTSKKNKD